jgi:hypothetical protein
MPIITYTQNVTIDGQSGGPHYKRGYVCDVKGDEMRRLIAAGVAILGAVEFPPEEKKKPAKTFSRRAIPDVDFDTAD